MNNRKIFIIDTSVLLYDKESIHSFPGNDVILPLVVLDELDSFKDKQGLLGESARYINRYLDSLRKFGRLDQGVRLKDTDQIIKVYTHDCTLHSGLDNRGDNKIIATALEIKNNCFYDSENENSEEPLVKIITKDINLRVKCDALGIESEDYYKDHVNVNVDDVGSVKIINVDDENIDEIYSLGSINFDSSEDLVPNSYCVVNGYSQGKSVLCQYDGFKLNRIQDPRSISYSGVQPRSKEQKFVLHALRSDKIPLVCLTGLAGSGKTFLTLMAALDSLMEGKFQRIVVTRNMEPVGRDIGFLPGDIKEKMAPWLSPLMDNFRHHFKDRSYLEMMIEKGQIEIAPLSFIRGRTFSNSFIIVDEAQNASIHELKTIITRIGDNSKIVLMGDTDQIDTPYIDKKSNGLSVVIDRFYGSELMAHIHLARGERSALATYASKIL
jgi:PhoH-like ATPase